MGKQKQKVSDLPENEQKELIQEAYSVGLTGILNNYGVETLKSKIAAQKALNEQAQGENEQDVIVAGDGGVHPIPTENEETETEENKEELPEGLSDGVKDFLEGKTDELSSEAEEIDEPVPGEKIPQKEEQRKINGICHICGSKVENGICSGCGFTKQ